MKFKAGDDIWWGELHHEEFGRSLIEKHWITPHEARFYKKDDMLYLTAKKDLEIKDW